MLLEYVAQMFAQWAWFLRFEITFAVLTATFISLSQIVKSKLKDCPKEKTQKLQEKVRPRVPSEAISEESPKPSYPKRPTGTPQHHRTPPDSLSNDHIRQSRAMARQAAKMILAESCRDKGKPLEMHQDALAAGTCFTWLQESEAHRLYMALGLAALRTEHADAAVGLLQDLCKHKILVPPALLTLIVKRCTSRRFFRQSLIAYDTVASEEGQPAIDDKEFWSCMVLSATESNEFHRCDAFWTNLKLLGPVAQDYGCMARVAIQRGDWEGSVNILKTMHLENMPLDTAVCNAVLSACVTAQNLKAGSKVLDLMEQDRKGAQDIVSYNTLMKGYAFADDLDEVFRLHARMLEQGMEPSQVTFGILLDACVCRGDLESAAAVFQDMIARGCPMNTVLYTTLIKGLARAGRLEKAMEVYTHMREHTKVKPDIILFSVLIKAHSDAGQLEGALRLFESMLELGHRPDEIVFNNLLVGCARDSNLEQGQQLMEHMQRLCVQPSHATASILIKLYAKCHVLDDAQKLLARMPLEFNIKPEPRLYTQLLHACIRERQGWRVVEVYKMMAKAMAPDTTTHTSILAACLSLNMLDAALELLEVAAEEGHHILQKDVDAVNNAAARRQTLPLRYNTSFSNKPRRCYCGP